MTIDDTQEGIPVKGYWLMGLCALVIASGIVSNAGATEVEITYPLDGDSVPMTAEIKGTFKDVPGGSELWIMVFPHGVNRNFPQDKRDLPLMMMANGDWTAQAIVGSSMDSGRQFKLFAVLADEAANEEILDYLDRCKENKSWPGLEALPDGADIYDYVTVTRK